jgi:hypothetical protein
MMQRLKMQQQASATDQMQRCLLWAAAKPQHVSQPLCSRYIALPAVERTQRQMLHQAS